MSNKRISKTCASGMPQKSGVKSTTCSSESLPKRVCGSEHKLTKTFEQFKEDSIKVHGDTYEYDETSYTTRYNKTKIICKKHGPFFTTPSNHIFRQSGCPKCKGDNISHRCKTTQQKFIDKASHVHGNTYDYSQVLYEGTHKKVNIICQEHGNFLQTPLNHLQGRGCPKCGEKRPNGIGGFTERRFAAFPELKTKPATLYVIKVLGHRESFIKIGITTKSIKDRLKFSSVFPYEYFLIEARVGLLYELFQLEQITKRKLKQQRYTPTKKFNGYTECFNVDVEPLLLKMINTQKNIT